MAYTNTQLKEAFLEMRGYNAESDGTPEEFLSKIEAQVQERLDEQLARIPTSARAAMKQRAVEYLANKEAEQTKLDNEGGEL